MDSYTQPGDRWRTAYRASVVSILGQDAPEVLSRGSRFYNVDRWTIRILVAKMCEWAKANPGVCATRTEVARWVEAANAEKVPRRVIVIASTPAKISMRVALALAGGGCHEAFHTRYSCRRALTVAEVCSVILPRWAQVADWSKLYTLLQEWNNIIEDIRIERRGNEEYPGVFQQLCNLQDFILAQELSAREEPSGAGATSSDTLFVATAMFRDLGLGYETTDQAQALVEYRRRNPEACAIVENGPLNKHLLESISLSNSDDMGCLRVAMDVLIELSRTVDPEDMKEASDLAASSGAKPKCPKCNAPGKDLVVRPLSDGRGGKVKGRGIVTCTKCGWQETIDLASGSGGGASPEPEDKVQYEDVPQQPGHGKHDVDDPSEGGSSDENEEESRDSSGEDESSEEGGGASEDGEGGEGSSSEEGEEGDGASEDGDIGERPPSEEGEGGEDSSGGDNDTGESRTSGDADSDGKPTKGAGGHFWDPDRVKAWAVSAEDFFASAATGDSTGLMDLGIAMEAAITQARKDEEEDLADDERPWQPWTTNLDIVQKVLPSNNGQADDEKRARQLLDSVRSQTAYLRAKLRVLLRSVEQRSTAHGVRRGKGLSERMLVDSVASLRSGTLPSRAYYDVSDKIDTSVAAAVILDESGSMSDSAQKLQDAARCVLTLVEPLDANGGVVLAAGFRNGLPNTEGMDGDDDLTGACHRHHGVCIDVFKTFDERFLSVKWRFANTRGIGSTPMADGVQFGLDALSGRREAHRVLFVVTDGEPDPRHRPVIQHQIRLATEAHIAVIGVGIGAESKYVMTLFPQHVWSLTIGDLPVKMMSKLTELLDFRGIGRGRPIRRSV